MKKHQGEFALKITMPEQEETSLTSPSGVTSFFHYIPNTLSSLRLLGTPFCLWSIVNHQLNIAFWGFFIICITDWFDGYLARRWNVTSKLGQILDPLADKFLLISTYLVLGLKGYIPLWITTLVLIRDILILSISCAMILRHKSTINLPPHLIGKVSTTLQMLFIGLVLAGHISIPSIPTTSIGSILMVIFLYSVALTTILSGIVYAQNLYRALINNC